MLASVHLCLTSVRLFHHLFHYIVNKYDCTGESCPAGTTADVCDGVTKTGGLKIFIDGTILGKEPGQLPYLPIGKNEVLLQVERGPLCYDYLKTEFVITSLCESNMNDFCPMPPLDPDADPTADYVPPLCNSKIETKAAFAVSWAKPATTTSRRATAANPVGAPSDASMGELLAVIQQQQAQVT